jgi:hypothetical protein
MEKKYVPGDPIPSVAALQAWLDTNEPVFYDDTPEDRPHVVLFCIVTADRMRLWSLGKLERSIAGRQVRFALPAVPEPEPPAEKPAKFRRKPTVVEALRWTGKNGAELVTFLGGPSELLAGMPPVVDSKFSLTIRLEEKVLAVEPGDYVVKTSDGEILPLSAKAFAERYEAVDAATPPEPETEPAPGVDAAAIRAAAELMARCARAQARIEGMVGENATRAAGGQSPAYGDEQFNAVADECGINEDAVAALFNPVKPISQEITGEAEHGS